VSQLTKHLRSHGVNVHLANDIVKHLASDYDVDTLLAFSKLPEKDVESISDNMRMKSISKQCFRDAWDAAAASTDTNSSRFKSSEKNEKLSSINPEPKPEKREDLVIGLL
jgi:hypothetical protein